MRNWWRAWRANEGTRQGDARRAGGWQCALLASLVVVGFLGLNLAGCGGGGGGGGALGPVAVNVTVQLRDINGNTVNGTVTLDGQTLTTSSGQALFTGLKPGSYQLTYDVQGDAYPAQQATIIVGTDSQQTFVAVPGVTGVGNAGITISGRILLNEGSQSTINCRIGSLGVCATVLVRVRDLNQPGTPIVASFIKPDQCGMDKSEWGKYAITNVPGSGSYRIEVRKAPPAPNAPPDTTAPFTGNSSSFSVTENQNLANLDICANPSDIAPGGTPPPPPVTPTPISTVIFPTAMPTATPVPTGTATATPTATATATTAPTATPTATMAVTATATPTATPEP